MYNISGQSNKLSFKKKHLRKSLVNVNTETDDIGDSSSVVQSRF